VSGEEEADEDPHEAYSSKYYQSLVQILSVRSLSVALTTSRSRIRRDHIRTSLTLSHQNGDDGIERKKSPAFRPVDDTGESSTAMSEEVARKER